MYRFNIPVPPDEDFPEVVLAQRMGEGFEKEYVEYEPRWRFDKRIHAVVVDEKFFYAMAGTAERLKAENDKLRELAHLVAEYTSADQCEGCVTKRVCNAGELDMCWIRKAILEKLHELGIEVSDG